MVMCWRFSPAPVAAVSAGAPMACSSRPRGPGGAKAAAVMWNEIHSITSRLRA